MNRSLTILASFSLLLNMAHAQFIELSAYHSLTAEQRADSFGDSPKLRLKDKMDFVELLALGVADADQIVRRRATQKTAMTLLGLQQMISMGTPVAIKPETLTRLSSSLASNLSDPDSETRAPAARALTATRAPSVEIENALLQAVATEKSEELRGNLIEALADAGYESERLRKVVAERAATATGKEFESITKVSARLRITDALPALIARLGEKDAPQVTLIRAIAEFGAAASAAKSKLESIASNPALSFQADASAALTAIAGKASDKPQFTMPFRDLVQNPEPLVPSTSTKVSSASQQVAASPAKAPEAKPSPTSEESSSTPWLVWSAVIVAAIGLLWLFLKKRK